MNGWRDAENRLHTTHTALGLMVIDTETLDLERTLELPVNRWLSTSSAVVLTGSEGSQTWCDEVCKPGNNEPEVEEDWLVVETSSDDWWGYETINLVNGQAGGRTHEVFGTNYIIVTDQGIYLAGQFGP